MATALPAIEALARRVTKEQGTTGAGWSKATDSGCDWPLTGGAEMEGCCNFGRPSASRKKGPCGPLLGELVSFRLMQANAELAVDGHGLQDDVEALAVFVREGAPDFQPFSLGLTLDLEFPNREGVKALSGLGLGVGGGLGHDVSLLEYADCVGSSQQTKQVGLAPGTSRSAAQVEGQNKVEEVHPCKPTSFASVPMKSNRPKQGMQGSTLPVLLSVDFSGNS